LLTLALGLSLFLGALPHSAAAGHRESPVREPAGGDIDRSARHPGDPVHLEASSVEFQPGCPLCILQLQTGQALLLPEWAAPPLLARGAVRTAVERAGSVLAPPLGPARAPPRLSSSL
jgi:hypothetical protein